MDSDLSTDQGMKERMSVVPWYHTLLRQAIERREEAFQAVTYWNRFIRDFKEFERQIHIENTALEDVHVRD